MQMLLNLRPSKEEHKDQTIKIDFIHCPQIDSLLVTSSTQMLVCAFVLGEREV